MNNSHNYGGPQLSRQKLIPRGKRKLLTVKENYPRQKEKTHGKKEKPRGKKKNLAAKRKPSRQKEKPHGKKKKTHGKKKNLAAKRKTSRQKEKPHGKKKSLTAKRKRLTAKRKDSRKKEKLIRGKRKKGMAVGRVFRSTQWEKKKAVKRGVIGLQDSYPMFSLAVLYQSLNRFTYLYICSQWVWCGASRRIPSPKRSSKKFPSGWGLVFCRFFLVTTLNEAYLK